MAQKYVVELEANVDGTDDVQELEKSLDGVKTSADGAQESLDGLSEQTIKNTQSMDGLTESVENQHTSAIPYGIMLFNLYSLYTRNSSAINRFANRMTKAGRVMRFLSRNLWGIGAAFTAVGLAIKTFNALADASHNYIQTNVDAMNDWRELLIDEEAWIIFRNNIELAIGKEVWEEAEKPWKTFWSEWSLNALEKIGNVLSMMQRTTMHGAGALIPVDEDTQAAIDDYNESGEEAEESSEKIATYITKLSELVRGYKILQTELKRESDQGKEIADDQQKTMEERLAGLDTYATKERERLEKQLERQTLEKSIIDEQINSNRVVGDELIKAQEIQENYAVQILKTTYAIEDLDDSLSGLAANIQRDSTMQITTLQTREANEEAQRYYDTLLKIVEIVDPNATTDVDTDLMPFNKATLDAKTVYLEEYKDFLAGELDSMGGMWGTYFGKLKQLYSDDLKWAKLESHEKIALLAGTASIALSIADQMIGDLASVAAEDFETQKKYRVASAVISTLSGMVSAFAGAMQLGPIAGPIVGAVLAAAVAALGATNISKINSSQPGQTTSFDSGITTEDLTAPSYTLINPLTRGESDINESLRSTEAQPVEAYVVSTNIESSMALDRQGLKNANF